MSRRVVAANVAALAVLAAGSVAFVRVMATLPKIEGRIPAAGLEMPASITRDEAGLAYVDARTQHDAYFALGWLHAQDRLWQMDLQRRVGTGRLAELVGPAGLPSDRFMRTLGVGRLAENGMAVLDQPTRDALVAYADGVNAWIDGHQHRLPPEYLALRMRPQPWLAADSLAWARVMALRLGGDWTEKLVRARLQGRLPPAQFADLWPPSSGPATLGALGAETRQAALGAETRDALAGLLAAVPAAVQPHQASNVWVVAGTRTTSGKPLLANDPHLGLTGGALWYLVSVRAPGLRLTGATIPGLPFHLVAHNDRVAWGTTSTLADTADIFLERIDPDGAVQTPAGPRPLATRQEIIRVAGAADEVLTVRESEHGPIISDVLPDLAGNAVALKTTALAADDRTAQAMYRLNRAVDWASFQAALTDFGAPMQNFAFADVDGAIGFATAGRAPVRRNGDGQSPVEGWRGGDDWTGWIAAAALPHQQNPATGIIVNANNRVGGDAIANRLARYWPDGYRAARIEQLLDGATKLDRQAMADIQSDAVSPAAAEIKARLGTPDGLSPLARRAAAMVAAWNGTMDKDRPEPLIYNAWVGRLWQRVFAPALGADFDRLRMPRPTAVLAALDGRSEWCPAAPGTVQPCAAAIAGALEEAVEALRGQWGDDPAAWRWGASHVVRFDHPLFSRIPVLDRLFKVVAATDGDNFTIDRGTFAADTFQHVHGPGLRVVFDLADLRKSTFILAPGQSGNPLSRHYDDLVGAWVANRGLTMTGAGPQAATIDLVPVR